MPSDALVAKESTVTPLLPGGALEETHGRPRSSQSALPAYAVFGAGESTRVEAEQGPRQVVGDT